MSKPIIVTGAAGFIGRNIAAELNRRGYKNLILVDSLGTDEKWKNLVGLQYEDLVQPTEFLNRLGDKSLGKAEAILHMGACSATTERNADFLLENNYRYTRNLAEWSLAHDVRFVYASSAATYGEGAQGYCDEDSATPTLAPLNMYGYSKHMFDMWALQNGLLDKLVGLKFFNVYGPYEEHKGDMRSVMHKAFGQVLSRGYLELFKSDKPEYADGEQMRDFIYVRDVVDVCLYFAFRKSGGGLFNCGTGKARTWKALATGVFTALDKPIDIRFIDMPDQLKGKYQYFTQADAAKLRKSGYDAPFTELEDGIKDYIQNYLLKKI